MGIKYAKNAKNGELWNIFYTPSIPSNWQPPLTGNSSRLLQVFLMPPQGIFTMPSRTFAMLPIPGALFRAPPRIIWLAENRWSSCQNNVKPRYSTGFQVGPFLFRHDKKRAK